MAGAGGDEFAAAAAHEAAPPEREPGMEEKPFTDFFFLKPQSPLFPPTSVPGSQRLPLSSGCPLLTPPPAQEDGMKPSLCQDGILDGKF